MAGPASPLEVDHLLQEIPVRLSPQPSSLPRASAVSKRWRRLVIDHKFHRRFRIHHGKPPLLGFFECCHKIMFTPVLDAPDLISPQRDHSRIFLLGCRHGRVLLMNTLRHEVIVWDPITRKRCCVPAPPELVKRVDNGTVLCADTDHDHVHGDCHSSPFKVVLLSEEDFRPCTYVYSSESGTWGYHLSTENSCSFTDAGRPGSLIGNCLYWLEFCTHGDILEFDLDKQRLTMIRAPPVKNEIVYKNYQIIKADDGVVGYAILSYPRFQMWQRNAGCHGVATWVLWKTIDMHTILGLPPQIQRDKLILGYSEDTDEIFIWLDWNVYTVQLELMQSKRLFQTDYRLDCHPFTGFYTPDTAIDGGCNEDEMLHDT